MEVCCTLGMLEKQQAQDLKKAGLTAYNHNLDTSREFYPNIITTRSYDERLQTLEFVRDAGINVCCGKYISRRGQHISKAITEKYISSFSVLPLSFVSDHLRNSFECIELSNPLSFVQ